ncbi:glycosyltransferase family 4 protein [Polaribacter porphyrae]|uniref:Glycosyl transferase family 1 n=1 Tax=Polaribacter porphyrae TaxID=1137780 RepID=A0A2S7WS52_9FLAO|nr:glycosyltransferase family 4 protein [Polaribacter porphyrae]PQJ80413.1 hypothetical protein BTO18_15085 [Polaribacter porphyrae]
MRTILFIHQSADLYGSDKTLLYLVNAVKEEMKPIVIIPENGPLVEELKKIDIEYFISPVVKISRQLFTISGILKLPFHIFKSVRNLKKVLGNHKIDIIHSNTLAVFLGAFYSRKHKIKHIWHVHEIIKHPKIVAKVYPYLVNIFSDKVVFNSIASQNQMLKINPKLNKKSLVIHNGLERNKSFLKPKERKLIRERLFDLINDSSIIIGLVGRINKHKGQFLLLETFEKLKKEHLENIYLLFIGSTTVEQKFLLDHLNEEIKKRNLSNIVKIIDFQKDIWKYYDCLDIVAVPTTDPEPFGLVALEGMLSRKAVIAANHGGLKEIVLDNKTGFLFKPNDVSDLKKLLDTIIKNKNLMNSFGEEGEKRAKSIFSLNSYIVKFKDLYYSF